MGLLRSLFQRQLVGLDIGVSGVKAVELTPGKNPRLIAYNRVPLPPTAISADGELKEREVVINAMKRLFEDRAFSSKKVAVGTFGNSIITKKISVPRMAPNELNHQLYWEAEQYLPFNVNEINLDFAILGNSNLTQPGSPMMDVLLVAAKKDYVRSITTLVQEAGLDPGVIDNQPFALGNVFEFNYPDLVSPLGGTYILLDFGAGSTKMSIVEGDKTTFTRELRQSGNACTLLISERLAMTFEQAEKAKVSEHSNSNVKGILTEFVSGVADEIARTIDFSMSQASDRGIQGIYICGGASRTAGLIEMLETKLPAPVQRLNPIQSVAGSGQRMSADAIREIAYLGAVSIGLALRTTGDS